MLWYVLCVCSTVTAAKELLLFSAHQWAGEERAACGCSHLNPRPQTHCSTMAAVTGDIITPAARTSSCFHHDLFVPLSSFSNSQWNFLSLLQNTQSSSPLPQNDTELYCSNWRDTGRGAVSGSEVLFKTQGLWFFLPLSSTDSVLFQLETQTWLFLPCQTTTNWSNFLTSC